MFANRELLGLRCEIIGLVFLLFAAIWQATFTDWFDKNSQGWVAYTQESVNIAVLRAIDSLSAQLQETDPEKKQKIRTEIYDNISSAMTNAISERQHMRALDKGQAKVFSVSRLVMFLLGATLIVLGKWLVLVHKRDAAAKAP